MRPRCWTMPLTRYAPRNGLRARERDGNGGHGERPGRRCAENARQRHDSASHREAEAARRLSRKRVEARIRPGTLAEMEAEFAGYAERLRTALRGERDGIGGTR
jgi:hypothetical protein